MLESDYILTARMAIRDALSDEVSLIGLIQDMGVVEFPMTVVMTVVSSVIRDPAADPEQIRVTGQITLDGETLETLATPITFNGMRRHRLFLRLQFEIPHSGELRISLDYDGLLTCTRSFHVEERAMPVG